MVLNRFRYWVVLLLALALGAVLIISPVVSRGSVALGWEGLIGAVVAVIALAVVVSIPVHWLPVTALILFVAVPRAIVPSEGVLNAVPVLSAILVIWVIRRFFGAGSHGNGLDAVEAPTGSRSITRIVIYVSAGLFWGWALFTGLISENSSTSIAWLTSFTVGALVPLLVVNAKAEAALVRKAWVISGGVMGAYAVVELALQSSPVYGALYRALGVPSVQHWSVYRAEASFYHPLYAGAFLSVGAALGIGEWLVSGRRLPLVLAMASAVGVVATVSRGSIVATAVAVGLAVLAAVIGEGRLVAKRLVVIAVLGVVALVGLSNFGALSDRTQSAEAELSEGARDTALEVSLRAAATSNWLGSGPGTSGISARQFDDGVIENSALQLLISVGIPGLALLAIMIAALVINALKSRDVASAAGLVAYVVCILGFNAIDALRGMHLLIGLLVLVTLNPAVRRAVAVPGRQHPELSSRLR